MTNIFNAMVFESLNMQKQQVFFRLAAQPVKKGRIMRPFLLY